MEIKELFEKFSVQANQINMLRNDDGTWNVQFYGYFVENKKIQISALDKNVSPEKLKFMEQISESIFPLGMPVNFKKSEDPGPSQ